MQHQDPIVIIALIAGLFWLGRKFWRWWQARTNASAFLYSDDMTPVEFEHACAAALRASGWIATTTKGSGDQGIDVLAERDGVKLVIQCKLYTGTVGNKAVQEAFTGKAFAGAQFAAVVSNGVFSRGAVEVADRTGVLLLHFTELRRINARLGLQER